MPETSNEQKKSCVFFNFDEIVSKGSDVEIINKIKTKFTELKSEKIDIYIVTRQIDTMRKFCNRYWPNIFSYTDIIDVNNNDFSKKDCNSCLKNKIIRDVLESQNNYKYLKCIKKNKEDDVIDIIDIIKKDREKHYLIDYETTTIDTGFDDDVFFKPVADYGKKKKKSVKKSSKRRSVKRRSVKRRSIKQKTTSKRKSFKRKKSIKQKQKSSKRKKDGMDPVKENNKEKGTPEIRRLNEGTPEIRRLNEGTPERRLNEGTPERRRLFETPSPLNLNTTPSPLNLNTTTTDKSELELSTLSPVYSEYEVSSSPDIDNSFNITGFSGMEVDDYEDDDEGVKEPSRGKKRGREEELSSESERKKKK